MDIAPPKRWRRALPSWLRSQIWVDAAAGYDCFLSYSWKSDKEVAAFIQTVVHRFLCPWYKTRAKTVFRDLSCLPAGSSLEGELFSRLDRSSHFVVLASPEAATSRGMELEAKYWFSLPDRKGEVLIIVTEGLRQPAEAREQEAKIEEPGWSEIRDHLLPPTLRSRFAASEPLWISLENRRSDMLANPRSETVRGQVIEDLKQIFLRLYPGTTWEELRGEERSQRRRALGLVASVAILFFFAAVLIFWQAWRVARTAKEAAFNYSKAVDSAAKTSEIVRRQLLPDGAERDRPKSITARDLMEVYKTTFASLPAKYETPAAGYSRARLFEFLWNGYFILGDYERATEVARAESELAQKYQNVPPRNRDDPSHADWLRVLCRAKENSGDDARVTKRPEEAEADFREALRLAKLISGAPGGSSWKDELPHAHERLGDILRDEGKFGEAVREFKIFLAIEATSGSDDPRLERNFAVLHGKIGDMLLEQRDLAGALKEFEENLSISERLGHSFPDNLDAQRGIAVAHERLGFVRLKQGNASQAARDYEQELTIASGLTRKDNENFSWARDEALANEGLGDVSSQARQFTKAYEYYGQYLKAIEHALGKAKSNVRIQREVAIAYQRLGDTSLSLGRLGDAQHEFQLCLATSNGASTAFEPRNPEPHDVRGYCQAKMSEALGKLNGE